MGWLKRRIIEELEPTMAEWERRWIPVGESLPNDESEVLVAFEDRSLGVAYAVFHHIDKNERPKWTDGDGVELKQPTHWMPLPSPPTDSK
jgi:hypothetical protein